MTPQAIDKFLDEQHVGIIVTINKDGAPNPMPIWYVHRDGVFLMRTGANSAKARNIRRDARISICVQSERLPYKSVTAWGAATLSGDDRGLGREIAVRYLGEQGAAAYLKMSAASPTAEEEVTITFRPERVFSQDYSAETTAADA
jgi:PPOX class probable F420-dependent enzyme